MELLATYRQLPQRLRRAALIWSGVGFVMVLLPPGVAESLGVGASLVFWCVLTILSLAPSMTMRARLHPARVQMPTRRRRPQTQARRRHGVRFGLRTEQVRA